MRCGMISDAAQDIGHPTAHVSRTGRQPDPHARWRRDHPRSTVMTRRSSTRLPSRPIRMVVPSVSVTSIPPSADVASARHAGGPACSLGSPHTGSLATRTGRNIGASSARSVPSRTRRRQFHNKPRLRSYRRATSTKLTPVCSSSATIRSLSSNRQRRRRSDPVIISIPTIVPVLNDALTSAVKINRPIHHRKAVLAGRVLFGSTTRPVKCPHVEIPSGRGGGRWRTSADISQASWLFAKQLINVWDRASRCDQEDEAGRALPACQPGRSDYGEPAPGIGGGRLATRLDDHQRLRGQRHRRGYGSRSAPWP